MSKATKTYSGPTTYDALIIIKTQDLRPMLNAKMYITINTIIKKETPNATTIPYQYEKIMQSDNHSSMTENPLNIGKAQIWQHI